MIFSPESYCLLLLKSYSSMCARKKKPRLEDFLSIKISQNLPYNFSPGAYSRLIVFLYSEADKLIKTSRDIEEGERADDAEELITETIVEKAIRKETANRPIKHLQALEVIDMLIQWGMVFAGECIGDITSGNVMSILVTMALVMIITLFFVYKTTVLLK